LNHFHSELVETSKQRFGTGRTCDDYPQVFCELPSAGMFLQRIDDAKPNSGYRPGERDAILAEQVE